MVAALLSFHRAELGTASEGCYQTKTVLASTRSCHVETVPNEGVARRAYWGKRSSC